MPVAVHTNMPKGVHLVGSIRLPREEPDALANPPSASEVFTTLSAALPDRLLRIPDGETGQRHYFILWQSDVFKDCPWVFIDRELEARKINPSWTLEEARKWEISVGPTGYDEHALNSYKEFSRLKEQGVIDAETRFQVCLPTPANVIFRFVRSEFQTQVEPLYEQRILETVRNLQAHIPAKDLAIQWDCALEFAMLEGAYGIYTTWFEPTEAAIVERLVRLASAVDDDVDMGYHLCYGDVAHKHFVQPKDATKLVDMANIITANVKRQVDWIHMPVPKDRTDPEYFQPLQRLEIGKTHLFLGLVHAGDQAGTEERIRVASKFVQGFGLGTECGWGRTPPSEVASIIDILKTLSGPARA